MKETHMIRAPKNLVAVYEDHDGDETTIPVIAFTDQGEAMVLNMETGCLVVAMGFEPEEFPEFARLEFTTPDGDE